MTCADPFAEVSSPQRIELDAIEQVFFRTDARGCWTFLNAAWTRITGFSIEESLGRSLFEFVHPEDRGRLQEHFQELIGGKEYCKCEFRSLPRDGAARWIEGYSRVSRGESGAVLGAWGVFSDVTGSKLMEERLRAAKEEAERASQAKNEFLSRVSHELRTPMNSILGFAELIRMDPLSPEQSSDMDRILRAGKHLLNLLNEILEISRIESGRQAVELEAVDPVEVMKSAVEVIGPMLRERGIRLRNGDAELPAELVLADRRKLVQVFLNLLSNAIKYNRESGEVVLGYAATGSHIRISVTDTGEGIAPELLPRLFQPFERLGAERSGVQGTGLGLALSKSLVELMAGEMGVESQPGTGSTFWVRLPRLERSSAEPPAADPPLELAGAGCVSVLYIEDNLTNIRLIEAILRRRPNVRLISAMQGNLGLEMARLHKPDLILLDLHLPDLSGFQVLQRLQQDPRTASIPVVIVTADELPGTRIQALEAGARALLTKPIAVKQFFATVDPFFKKAVEA